MDCHNIRQQLFDDPSEETLYIAELEESVLTLEARIFEFLDTLPDADKSLGGIRASYRGKGLQYRIQKWKANRKKR